MKVGTINYATEQGLGILVKDFHKNGVVTDVMIVEHGSRETHYDWYPGAPVTPARPFNADLAHSFIDGMDVMLFFETPFHWPLIDYCRRKHIRTVLMPMYECMPQVLPAMPDFIINPSQLDQRYYPQKSKFIPIPVEWPWRERNYANIFVHNAGHGGLKGRNGTRELVLAMQYVESKIELLLRSQDEQSLATAGLLKIVEADPRIKLELGSKPYSTLYDEGDVFIFPEKFNGLSLPLQEARAAGMLVMCGARFPMTEWLPKEPLIPVKGYRKLSVGGMRNTFDEAQISPEDIADTIDAWHGRSISNYSISGREWAATMSWEALKPLYLKALQCA